METVHAAQKAHVWSVPEAERKGLVVERAILVFGTYLRQMFPVKMPSLVTGLFPRWLWHKSREDKVLYLTFDDGPSPGITEEVLGLLAAYNARGTFFCIGDKVRKHPRTLLQVAAAGHAIGNHTYNHLNLWKTPLKTYLDNADQCAKALKDVLGHDVGLFRPPYGKMTPWAGRHLLRQFTEIVMWDIISGDFRQDFTPERVTGNVLRHAHEGSIVVFHDSEKAQANMIPALKKVLEHFAALGYRFEAL
jgi:peptidoglycan-N-acetylglucosamine deacetylase